MLGGFFKFTVDKDKKVKALSRDVRYKVVYEELRYLQYKAINSYRAEEGICEGLKSELNIYSRSYRYIPPRKILLKLTLSPDKEVIFADSFEFYDIAPVHSVDRGVVYYYDDAVDGRVNYLNPRTDILFYTSDKGISQGDLSSISKNDTIHMYGKGKVIVRKDCVRDKITGYVFVDNTNFLGREVMDIDFYRPVYSCK